MKNYINKKFFKIKNIQYIYYDYRDKKHIVQNK